MIIFGLKFVILFVVQIRERFVITSLFLSKLDDYVEQHFYWRRVQLSLYVYELRLKSQIDFDKCISNLANCVNAINQIIYDKR